MNSSNILSKHSFAYNLSIVFYSSKGSGKNHRGTNVFQNVLVQVNNISDHFLCKGEKGTSEAWLVLT